MNGTVTSYFLNDVEKTKYFMKLIPDFSIFDIAEKYCIDNNIESNEIFLYSKSSQGGIYSNFYRAIFKIKGKNETLDMPSSDCIIFEQFLINGDLYIIAISRRN